MGFLRWFGFENANFRFTTERLGIAIFCALLTIGSTFTPIINTPHVLLNGAPSDMSDSRGFITIAEVLGIVFNLVGLRKWAMMLLGLTVYELILEFVYAVDITEGINKSFREDPFYHYTELCGLGWGWWIILLGPCIMAGVLLRDYLREDR